jgi:hypothetical protein
MSSGAPGFGVNRNPIDQKIVSRTAFPAFGLITRLNRVGRQIGKALLCPALRRSATPDIKRIR